MRRALAGVMVAGGLFSIFGLEDSFAAGPVGPKPPGAAPKPQPTITAIPTATPPAPIFYKPSVGGKDTTPYSTQAAAQVKCSDNVFQLNAWKDATTSLARAYCQKQGTYPEAINANCPGGWGYVVTDDKFVPEIKAKFGNTDMCFRNDTSTRDKKDPANYKPLNCVVGPNGATAGFVLKVYPGQDKCERDAAGTTLQTPGAAESTKTLPRPTDEQIKEFTVICPPLSYMWVAGANSTALLTTPVGTKGSIFCRKN